ncbi:hypothetical protein L195_g049434 [Trifolium pratense]|uniref:Uncharacterized protein n=1 Tax=Trifolium pratense TaxID=57577 RepID=A0A2K3JP43_TRIPR|nr:hypothetical protein L195_g049434 [Trifolium pratense]
MKFKRREEFMKHIVEAKKYDEESDEKNIPSWGVVREILGRN